MADFRRMTVEALRRAAARLLGKGSARLRTRRELVEALEAAGKGGKGEKATRRGAASARGRARGKGARKRASAPKARKAPGRRAGGGGRRRKPSGAARKRAAPALTLPDPEGHFVARVRGEEALRRAPHPMTEAAVEAQGPSALRALAEAGAGRPGPEEDEGLGDLPWTYQDDALAALPRDPRTLFLYWDHAPRTLAEAFRGLEEATSQLWLFARGEAGGWERVRTVDFALESRSYYLHDLEPGRLYRVEIRLVDRQGRTRVLARPSNEVRLPNLGPSRVVDDRFARIPWDLPLARWRRELLPGGPFPEEARDLLAGLSDWSRLAGAGGRPSSPVGGPTSPGGAPPGRQGT